MMSTEHNQLNPPHEPTDGPRDGFEVLGRKARVDYRMLKDGQDPTPEVQQQLRSELDDWCKDHSSPKDPHKPYPLSQTAARVGVSPSVLTEWLRNKYKGDSSAVARKIDTFFAEERERAGRYDFRQTAKIELTARIWGTIRAGIRGRTMPVIIGPPGSGKTAHALAFAKERGGVVVLRIEDAPADRRTVTELLCDETQELRPMKAKPHRRRLDSIKQWLRKRRNTVLIVDEAQKLSASGLELLRDLHDGSDPTGRHCLPIVFFGDENFYKLLNKAKSGASSPIAPQMIRRMIPVFDIVKDGAFDSDGTLYSVDDIVKIVRNDRVKLLTAKACGWLALLANTEGYGLLGFAIAVLRQAADLAGSDEKIDVEHLGEALLMTAGRSLATEVDQAAGGELLRRVG
ncbi:MAG: ATP-binding protein [Planctomycetota bacterium]